MLLAPSRAKQTQRIGCYKALGRAAERLAVQRRAGELHLTLSCANDVQTAHCPARPPATVG